MDSRGWTLEDGWLRRKYSTDGWPTTLMLVNAVGYLCEAAWHHADLAVTWGKVWVKLKTHSAGGITDKDFALAKKIEEVVSCGPRRAARWKGRPTSSCRPRVSASIPSDLGNRCDAKSGDAANEGDGHVTPAWPPERPSSIRPIPPGQATDHPVVPHIQMRRLL